MIIPNGHIRFVAYSGGGLDGATGLPVAPSESYMPPVPCQAVPSRQDYTALSDGQPHRLFSYDIYIEEGSAPVVSGRLLLIADAVGAKEFDIIAVERLLAVRQIRITV